MRYARKIKIFGLAAFLVIGLMAIDASAQVRGGFHFGGGGLHRPFIGRSFYGLRDPFWNYGYWGNSFYREDPYMRDRRLRYDREKSVRDARNKIAKDNEKFQADRFISPKEQEKLDKDTRKYNEAVEKLNKFNRER